MNFDLKQKASENVIVVAHRGACGGNIPCNTLAAYEIALMQGADMLETDVSMCADGTLVVFHPKMEAHHLCSDKHIPELSFSEVKELRYVNMEDVPTQFGILSFDDFLENFKGRCFINVDKFWDHPEEIYRAIKRHGMEEQILVKSGPNEKVISVMEELANDIQFMPVVGETHPMHEALMKKNINYVGVEVVFKEDTAETAGAEFVERMHRDGKLVWVNSIIFSYKTQLSGGHSDDTALTQSKELGWGWLADRGYDFIQTDWTMMLIDFLKKTNRYYRNR